MGHEATGEVVEVGSEIKNHKRANLIVMPFTLSCGECFYCEHGYSLRCGKSLLFGCPLMDGSQAEFLRVPLADGTAMKAPSEIDERKLVLMADIIPTGYFAAANAFRGMDEETIQQSTVVLIGCGGQWDFARLLTLLSISVSTFLPLTESRVDWHLPKSSGLNDRMIKPIAKD